MRLQKTIMTSLYMIVGLSVVFSILGAALSHPLLALMGTPDNIMDGAAAYLRIIFLGSLAAAVYNMANAISRALGDSVTPLIVLVITALLNVGLDLLFVISFRMGVAGAACATVLAAALSAAACTVILVKKMPFIKPSPDVPRWDNQIACAVVKIGFPSVLQSSSMSLGNVLIQGIINSFGSTFSAATKIDNLLSWPPAASPTPWLPSTSRWSLRLAAGLGFQNVRMRTPVPLEVLERCLPTCGRLNVQPAWRIPSPTARPVRPSCEGMRATQEYSHPEADPENWHRQAGVVPDMGLFAKGPHLDTVEAFIRTTGDGALQAELRAVYEETGLYGFAGVVKERYGDWLPLGALRALCSKSNANLRDLELILPYVFSFHGKVHNMVEIPGSPATTTILSP